jgi:hypothetical protein
MPPPQHYRVTWSGILGPVATPAEIWSFSLAVNDDGPTINTKAGLEALATSCRLAWSRWQLRLANSVRLTRTRVALVGANGRVVVNTDGAYVQGDNVVALQAGGSTPISPPQVALAISTQSAAAGATGRGRFYLPMPDVGSVGTDLRLSTATRDQFRDVAVSFIDDVNRAFSPAPSTLKRVCIASGGSTTQGIPPALRTVSTVRVGRVLDTIQRRRNALGEDYSVGTIP